MYVTGNNFRLTPEVSQMRLSFSDLALLGTGRSEIGVSGAGNILKFQFSGSRVISPDNKWVGSYNSGEPFDLDWIINSTGYQFSLGNSIIANRKAKTNFNIQRFFINTLSGAPITANAKIYCQDMAATIDFDTNFLALQNLTGRVSNSTAVNFRVFDSSMSFLGTNATLLSGLVTGDITGLTTRTFSLSDLNTSRFDSEVQFLLKLNTTIGPLSGQFTVNRLSGLDTVYSKLVTSVSGSGINIPVLFDGSGVSGNVFTYYNTPASYLVSYFASSTDLRGDGQDKIITVKLETSSPVESGAYRKDYVTGFSIVSGGEYINPPTLIATGYDFVSGLDWVLSSILLSSGCSGDLPVRFSGNNSNSSNASGVLKTTRVMLSGTYGEGLNTYYLPQSFSLVSGGTGYVTTPRGWLQTGIYSNCYDVGAKYNTTYSLYKPFSGSGLMASQADFLTGEVLCQATPVSGGAVSGYKVTGVRITNPGSGYLSGVYIPKVAFYRSSGDTLTANATGNFMMATTGFYSLTGNWSLETGLSSTNLVLMTGTSGIAYLTADQSYFTVKINQSGRDYTSPIVAKMTVALSGAESLIHLLTGSKRYDTSTGFLKKKNTLGLTTYSPNAELSFLLEESDIDAYYSSAAFMGNTPTIDIGDLDF
jgi:hypothetical protein